jgi:hypothetical protein
MLPAVFEPTIPTNERPQTYALDGAATGTGKKNCIRNTIILQKQLTAACFGHYWSIIREYNNWI